MAALVTFLKKGCQLQLVESYSPTTIKFLALTINHRGQNLTMTPHAADALWIPSSWQKQSLGPPSSIICRAFLCGYAQDHTHSYAGPASCQRHKNTLTGIHTDRVILGYWYPLTKSPQTHFMCCKSYTKKRREEKSVHFVWNSRFEWVTHFNWSKIADFKERPRFLKVPPGFFFFFNILCSTSLCLRGLRLAVCVQ